MKLKELPGDIFKIPFKEGWHTYGRVLEDHAYAFYDYPSQIDIIDFTDVLKSEILFIAIVDVFAIREGYWKIVKNIPLEASLSNFCPRYFNPNPANPVNYSFYQVYKTEVDDAIEKDWIKTGKIQLDGIHGHNHVESRIRDYYEGKRNSFNAANIEVFKKCLGLE